MVNVGLCLDIYKPISFELGMMTETIEFYIHMPLWMTLTFIQGHSCMRNKKPISCKFPIDRG